MDKPAKRFLFKGKNGENYLFPFVLVCSLFLMWGFAHALLDVLNSHFQEVLGISKAKSAFIQFSLYGGDFVMGIPAGIILKKYGKTNLYSREILDADGTRLRPPGAHPNVFQAIHQ